MIKANNNIDLREKLCELALLQINKKYQKHKMGPDSFDCCGLVWYIYNTICNIDLYGDDIVTNGTGTLMTSKYGILTEFVEGDTNKDIKLLNGGDILFFHRHSLSESIPTNDNKYPGHCGIYLGDYKFIHAPYKEKKVVMDNINNNTYYFSVLVGSRNIIDYYKIKTKKLH